MKSSRGYVFDTNVLVSALLFERSKPGQAFHAAIGRGEILLSLPVAQELNDVLKREKFRPYITSEERERFLVALVRGALFVEISERIQACRDPKDDMFLELAVNGSAKCIVSGDKDLLCLNPFRGIPILTPEQFLVLLARGQ